MIAAGARHAFQEVGSRHLAGQNVGLPGIADGDIVCAIGDFSRTVVLFFITMLCVGTMYFLLIVQVLLVGNLTVLLR